MQGKRVKRPGILRRMCSLLLWCGALGVLAALSVAAWVVVTAPELDLSDITPDGYRSTVLDDRGEEKSKFEKLEFQRRVRENYLSIAREKGFIILDATGSRETLLSQSMEHIMEKQR